MVKEWEISRETYPFHWDGSHTNIKQPWPYWICKYGCYFFITVPILTKFYENVETLHDIERSCNFKYAFVPELKMAAVAIYS